MAFIINDTIKIADLQQAFTSMFPYLRLELYRKGVVSGNKASELKQPIVAKDKTLAEVVNVIRNEQIEVLPNMTVSELEAKLKNIFGISLQVFRRSGNVWLLTSFTDSWTLEEQNQQGELITQQVNERKTKAS